MAHQIILIDRKKYAVGLFWQPIAIGFVSRNYARQLSKSIDKKLNLFTEYRAMVALGARSAGHRSGIPAAAPEIMEVLAEFSSFLAVFKVDNGFWLVAVRNGIIINDKLFDDQNAARDEYIRLSEIPDWAALFAPSAWGMPRSVERHLSDVVSGNVKAVLKPISRLKADFISLLLLVLFVLGAAYFFKEPIAQMLAPKPQLSRVDPVLAEEYKKLIEEKNKELDKKFKIKKTEQKEPLEMPYDFLPEPKERAETCYKAIGFLMQQVPGWAQIGAECQDTHANATFMRGYGNIVDFYEIAADKMPGVFVKEKSESEIFIRARLPELKTAASLEEKDAETVAREVNALFQRMNSTADVNITVDTIGDGIESVNLDVVEIAAESKLTPLAFIDIFNNISGVYMTRCAWDVRSKTWNYEVIIYAK
ncbi:MAG: type 4b pilus protein PilO2 [Rickettsiales bacterium]|nr:type 4b pilus protein PilO2 [Rickettsiales bacterium]